MTATAPIAYKKTRRIAARFRHTRHAGDSMQSLADVLRRLLHMVLPGECAGCGTALSDDPVPFFCRPCWAGLSPLGGPACPRCGRPFASPVALTFSPDHLCGSCRQKRPAYTKAWSLYPYAPPLRDALRLFKYRGKVALADALGRLLHSSAMPQHLDLLMPVPIHSSRLREREFNQSLLLADRLNRRLQLPLSFDNLVRLRPTVPQTELSRSARLKNLRRAFAVLRPDDVREKRILLIDDVFTTGTTVNECAKALRKAGAADIYVCTLARTI
ncbi:MAG: ComF family protein [Nitrospirota bacterium]|nr:ComF family protein [Nitrospirota bacterium]